MDLTGHTSRLYKYTESSQGFDNIFETQAARTQPCAGITLKRSKSLEEVLESLCSSVLRCRCGDRTAGSRRVDRQADRWHHHHRHEVAQVRSDDRHPEGKNG